MQFPVYKYGLTFRLVEESDAEFILGLRTDPKLSKYLSPVKYDLGQQIDWIRKYKEREAKGEELYFLFEDSNKNPLGVLRLHDFVDNTFYIGSWIVKPSEDEFAAIKSYIFSSLYALNELKLENCYIFVRKDNKKTLRFHKMFATQIDEDQENIYFSLGKEAIQKKCDYLANIIESEVII